MKEERKMVTSDEKQETGSSNAVIVTELWDVTPHIYKWLFDIEIDNEDGHPFPELIVFWADETKMHEYLDKLRGKGRRVSCYNISALERRQHVTIEDILAD